MPATNKKLVPVYVDTKTHEKMKRLAAAEKKPASAIVREMIEAYCDDTGVEKAA